MSPMNEHVVQADGFALDTLIKLFYGGDEIVAAHDDHLRNAIKLVLMTLAARPLRTLLVGGRRVLSNDGPKVYGLSQFAGACESVMAGAALLRSGYPHEVATLCRRAFETGAVALYYIDHPDQWKAMTAPITRANGAQVYRTPSIGKVVDYFVSRGSRLADASGVKEFYDQLSRHVHSGPGVRAHANLLEMDRLRLGPISALPDDSEFRKGVDLLKLTAEALHAMASFAYAEEINAAESDNDVPPIGRGEFA